MSDKSEEERRNFLISLLRGLSTPFHERDLKEKRPYKDEESPPHIPVGIRG